MRCWIFCLPFKTGQHRDRFFWTICSQPTGKHVVCHTNAKTGDIPIPVCRKLRKERRITTNNKDTFLSVRLKPEDQRKLRQLTEQSGLRSSTIIRKLIHGTEIKPRRPEGLKEVALAINREGRNINQIARNANAGILTENDVAELMLRQAKIEELLWKVVNS